MKLNYTVALTLILLALMSGAGYTSGVWGFKVGREALKGVTQPDARPTSKIKIRKQKSQTQAPVALLKEQDIIATVKLRISGKGKNPKPQKPQPQNKKVSQETPARKTQWSQDDIFQPGFPIISRNQGVTLQVLSARYSGGVLLLRVNLKNESSKAVRFLYSFLDVKDEQGRTLSANTEDLPEELPANGEALTGTVSIPTALLDHVKKLSLMLTDYPDQKLLLQTPEIPVAK